MTTLRPGMCASSASRLCECWLPDERPAPNWVRTVSAISRGAAGHERQLRGLVEQLVEADAEEVEVHELDHRPHARHRGADAEADDRALGDRRVADAIAEAVVQAADQAEHVAARPRRRCPRRTRARRSASSASSAASDRVHGAEHRRVGGRCRRLGALGSRAGDEVGQRARPPGAASRRAASTASSSSCATDACIDSSASSVTPADRSRRALTSSGSRASHSCTSSGDR